MSKLLFATVLVLTFLLEIFLPRRGDLEISFQPQKILFLAKYQVGSSYEGAIGKVNSQTKTGAQNRAQAKNQGDNFDLSVAFRLGSYYGFHDRELNMLSYDVMPEPLPLSHRILGKDFYLDLYSVPNYVVIRDIARREIGRIPGTGKAFLVKEGIYQLGNEGHSLQHYSRTGELKWHRDLLPYISSLDHNILGETLISYAEGRVILLDRQGEVDNEYISSGSRVNSVYGGALSADSQNVALIAGLDRQRFVFLQKQQGTYLFQYARELPNQLRHSQWLRFSDGAPYVFYSSSEGISVYNFASAENRLYHADGFLNQFGEQVEADMQFFVFRTAQGGSLLALHGSQGELLRLKLYGNNYSLRVKGDTIYLGQDNIIVSYRTEYL